MRVVFLGTPDFSVPTLDALIKSKHEVLAVVTQPDKKRDRNIVSFSPVKEAAVKNDIMVLQYNKIRAEGVEDLRKLNPDIMVTCAYGQIISQEILDIPKFGVINVHASLLPKYRGSSPIQWAILNGESETGITIMRTALGVDSGDIILQEKTIIDEEETAGELFDRLSKMGPDILLHAMDLIEKNQVKYLKQDEKLATHFPMLSKEDGKIDWNKPVKDILNKIRGMNPWPSAFSVLKEKLFKIWTAKAGTSVESLGIGVIKVVNGEVLVGCLDGTIVLQEVQLEGKKRMPIDIFLLGNNVDGEMLK